MLKAAHIFFLFAFVSINCWSQRYSFLSYNTAQGLPQSQVTSVSQDKDGYLWVGTLGGLAKFNGKDFQTFSTEDGLLNNRITFIGFIDNVLWVGHEGGISRINQGKITKWAFNRDNKLTNVSKVIKFKNHIIIASNGGGLFELKNDALILIKLHGDESVSFSGTQETHLELHYEDDLRVRDVMIYKNELLVGTRGGILKTSDLKTFRHIENLEALNVSGFVQQGDKLYVTTFNNGLVEWTIPANKINIIKGIDTLLTLRGCVVDSKGNLWINSSDGVFRLNNGKISLRLNHSNGLPMESIRSVFEDQQGNIWFGSEGKGLLRFPGEIFVYFNEVSGLTSDLILTVNQDSKGNYWIGTLDRGLMVMSKNKKITPINFENSGTIWASALGIDGFNWFGTGTGLVAMKNQKIAKVFYAEDGLPGDKITALLKLSSTSFYIGGADGVSLYQKGKFKQLKMKELATVRNFCRIDGNIYCATDKGLFVIRNNRLELVGNFRKTIYSLVKDKNENLWIGTEEGLFCLKSGRIGQVIFSKVPSSNFINFLNYSNDKLFVGTNNGLFVLSDLDKPKISIVNYGIAEGVVNLETNLNSSFIDEKGFLWFGTASGLVSYNPKLRRESFSSPQLILKNILINYQHIDYKKYSDGTNANGLPINLRLPFSKNNLTFEIDGISLSNYPGMKFQYWLEGQGTGWSPLNANTTVTFNGLPAGNYNLHARSVDSRGNVSEEIKFQFTINQAFYKTWWFIGLSMVLLIFLIYRIFQFRLIREREINEKETLEYKSRLLTLEQKSLNASMNRHFIFNSLNSIQYFINTQDRLSANRFLTNFAKLIRKNLDSSDDGSLVPLSQELERLELYMSLESMRFKDRFNYTINCPEGIDAESIIIPAMMLQPFIENSIIHGILPEEDKVGLIEVNITLEKDLLIIEIDDNGVGIETSINSKLNYDGDHRSQGMEITTKRIELLKKLSNRYFELIGPIQINNNDSSIKGTRVTLKFQVENLDY
jgi:ligand-binding sensor domain-containing protein